MYANVREEEKNRMMLPVEFLENMKALLGAEYPDYIGCMEKESRTALRVNTLKLAPAQFRKISPFALEEVSWTEKGFYYDTGSGNPARHPYFYAGLYYIQEPSAMIPASLLPVERGDKVLDLCAAPGGKATELAAKLDGTGLLVANDISISRGKALAKNLQVAGVRNAVVTAETPQRLAECLGGFFDKILIDAPCSGEGMFRRAPQMVKDWLEHGPEYYAGIQRQILEEAWKLLRPGGKMVYSTCTFSLPEDEGTVQGFLDSHSDMHICPVERREGFSRGMPELVENGMPSLKECVRIFPHRAQGEGHFAVLMEKEKAAGGVPPVSVCSAAVPEQVRSGKQRRKRLAGTGNKKGLPEEAQEKSREDFLEDIRGISGNLSRHKDFISLETIEMGNLSGLRTIFSGLILGEQKKKRFEPGPQLALAIGKEDYPRTVDLPAQDVQVIKYLKGETVTTDSPQEGYILFCVDGYPLGWCKGNGTGVLKNKYYPGWRMQ